MRKHQGIWLCYDYSESIHLILLPKNHYPCWQLKILNLFNIFSRVIPKNNPSHLYVNLNNWELITIYEISKNNCTNHASTSLSNMKFMVSIVVCMHHVLPLLPSSPSTLLVALSLISLPLRWLRWCGNDPEASAATLRLPAYDTFLIMSFRFKTFSKASQVWKFSLLYSYQPI